MDRKYLLGLALVAASLPATGCAASRSVGTGVYTVAAAPIRIMDEAASQTQRAAHIAERTVYVADRASKIALQLPLNPHQQQVLANTARAEALGQVQPRTYTRQVTKTYAATSQTPVPQSQYSPVRRVYQKPVRLTQYGSAQPTAKTPQSTAPAYYPAPPQPQYSRSLPNGLEGYQVTGARGPAR